MENRVALMIDAENVSYKYIDEIIKEISKYGRLTIARFYGNINGLSSEWKEKALEYAIKPMHQYNIANGKNSADMEMTIDTLEIKYQNKADIFFIVSSDSDFTPLAIKLKELGATVIGIGDENKVTAAYKNSCTEFKYFQYFDQDDKNANELSRNEDIKVIIENIIIENSENNILQLSRLGDILIKQYSDFDPRKYGSSNLSSLVEKLGFTTSTENTTKFVKLNLKNDINEIKNYIEKQLSKNNNKGNISETKRNILEHFEDFNEKKYGASKFSTFLKQLGYVIKGNYFFKE